MAQDSAHDRFPAADRTAPLAGAVDRRRFLRLLAVTGAAAYVAPTVVKAEGAVDISDCQGSFVSIENEIPVVPGGLTGQDIQDLCDKGWERMSSNQQVTNWPVTFGTGKPGETIIKCGTIPAGTEFMGKQQEAILVACGNP